MHPIKIAVWLRAWFCVLMKTYILKLNIKGNYKKGPIKKTQKMMLQDPATIGLQLEKLLTIRTLTYSNLNEICRFCFLLK